MIRIFTTCPPSSAYEPSVYPDHVRRISRWSEANGAEGMLIYTDNQLVDPFLVVPIVFSATERLVPLLAIQPIYRSPFQFANSIASLFYLYGRTVSLNMVTGGFVRDLTALGDTVPHDDRYLRLFDYVEATRALLTQRPAVHSGPFYSLDAPGFGPQIPGNAIPEIFVSGSSRAGAEVAARLGATPVAYPSPPGETSEVPLLGTVARLGIIARDSAAEAWALARARFPNDPRGRMAQHMAEAVSDSAWHRRLSELGARLETAPCDTYWMHPFNTYKTFCPYLVGDHEGVGALIANYLAAGFAGFILDVPETQEDLPNAVRAIALAAERVGRSVSFDAGAPANVPRLNETV